MKGLPKKGAMPMQFGKKHEMKESAKFEKAEERNLATMPPAKRAAIAKGK